MASTSFGNIIDTVTNEYLVPKVTDNVLTGNVLLMRWLGKKSAKSWGEISGTQVLVPIKYQSSTSGGWYSGFDTFSTTQVNTRINATFTPKQLYWSIVLSGIQEAVNQGPQRVLDLLTIEMQSNSDDMASTLGTALYASNSSNSKQLAGLDDAVDDGNGTATYAGLARGTYTTWVSNLDDSTNAISLAEIADSVDAATIGSDTPTIMVTTPAIWGTIEGLCQGTVTLNMPTPGLSRTYGQVTREGVRQAAGADPGFACLFYRGIPIVSDEKCTSGRFYVLNEKHIGLATWPYPDFPGYVTKGNYNGFCFTGLKIPTNQDATVGQFLWYGQLITDSCRTHAYMTNKS